VPFPERWNASSARNQDYFRCAVLRIAFDPGLRYLPGRVWGENKMKKEIWVLASAVLVFVGCAKDVKNDSPTAVKPTAMETLSSDRQQLVSVAHDGFAIADAKIDGNFSKIFGGTTEADITHYLDERLHDYFDPADASAQISPEGILGPDPFNTDSGRKDVVMGAANESAAMWFASVIYGVPVTFSYQGKSIPVESTRTGIMMIGPGYNQLSAKTQSGTEIQIPAFYRQAILLHEARHSDCTGGLSSSIVSQVRTGDGSAIAGLSCSHTHVICPPGHDYAGIAACDAEGWGAYTVGQVFSIGVSQDSNLNSTDSQIAQMMAYDNAERVLVARTGSPDMSSGGLNP
jgi:hypothetical protein